MQRRGIEREGSRLHVFTALMKGAEVDDTSVQSVAQRINMRLLKQHEVSSADAGQCVLCGDPKHLPPVKDKLCFSATQSREAVLAMTGRQVNKSVKRACFVDQPMCASLKEICAARDGKAGEHFDFWQGLSANTSSSRTAGKRFSPPVSTETAEQGECQLHRYIHWMTCTL